MTFSSKIAVARSLYAIALIAFGMQQFLFGTFVAGRAPEWPAALPGEQIFAYVTGLLFVLTGISTLLDKKSRLMLMITGTTILLWAAFRNILAIIAVPEYGALLTSTFKALTLGTGAFVVADTFPLEHAPARNNIVARMATVGRYVAALFLLVAGIQHFLFADFVMYLIPLWIPGALFWTYFSGVALAAAGVGLLTGIKAPWAALLSAIMIFAWVLLLHVPRAIVQVSQNEWTAVFEALAVSGILFLIWLHFKRQSSWL